MPRPQVTVAAALLLTGALVATGLVLTPVTGSPSSTRPARPARSAEASRPAAESSGQASDSPALRVLRAWDRARAAAYASGSVTRLRALYRPDSAAGRRDVRLLERYAGRGYRVVDMEMQILAVRVLGRTHRAWRLRVTDRLHRAVAVGRGERVPLPRDRASTQVVELVRNGSGWQVGTVRRVP